MPNPRDTNKKAKPSKAAPDGGKEGEDVDFTFSDIPILGKGGGGKGEFSFETFDAKTTGGAKQFDRQKDKLESFTVMLQESPVAPAAEETSEKEPTTSIGWRLRRLSKLIKRRQDLILASGGVLLFLVVASTLAFYFVNARLKARKASDGSPRPAATQQDNRVVEEVLKLVSLADAEYNAGNMLEAREKYRNALEKGKGEKAAAIHLKLANCLQAAGAVNEALGEYAAAIDSGLVDSTPIIAVAQSLAKAHDFDAAVLILEKAAGKFPSDKKLLVLLADCHYHLGDMAKAAEEYAKTSKTELSNEQMASFATALLKSGRKTEASDVYAYAAERFDNLDYYFHATELAENVDEKVRILAKATSTLITPKDKGSAMLKMIEVLYANGRKSEAIEKAKMMSVNDLPSEKMLAYASFIASVANEDPGLKASLKERLSGLINLRGSDLGFQIAMQDILLGTRMSDLALELYSEWSEAERDNPQRNYLMARCLGPASPNAKTYCLRAVALKPVFPEALAFLGDIFIRERDWPAAIDAYKKCATTNPDDLEPRRMIAMAKLRSGAGVEAVVEFEKYLETHKVGKAKAAQEVFDVALLLPKPDKAAQCLQAMSDASHEFSKKDLKLAEIKLKAVFGQLDDKDFIGYCPAEARVYQILHLLANGRYKEVALVPTPADEFPDFWKIFVCWRHKLGEWPKSAETILEKYKDRRDSIYSACAALWLGKATPEDIAILVRKVDPESEPLLYFMIAEKLKRDKKGLQAKVFYVKALASGNSIYKGLVEYYRNITR